MLLEEWTDAIIRVHNWGKIIKQFHTRDLTLLEYTMQHTHQFLTEIAVAFDLRPEIREEFGYHCSFEILNTWQNGR